MARPFEALNCLIREHDMIPRGSTVLCALSGGADSIYLLHRLYLLRIDLGFRLVAAHYNHHLRGEESVRDEEFVRQFVKTRCKAMTVSGAEGEFTLPAVELYVGGGDVREEAARRKQGLEETARDMRYEFLRQTAADLGGAIIATAHTANDNAETVLLHLIRGSGLRGLTGIRPVGEGLIRPMLTTTRREVEEYLRIYSLPHVEDSSNTDETFTRNRLRRRVFPQLEELYPGTAERLSDTAALLRIDEDYLTALAQQAVEGVEPKDGVLRLPADRIGSLPDALAPRAVRLLLARLRDGDTDLAAPHLLGVTALCRGSDPSARLSLPGGLIARREYADLVVCVAGTGPKVPEPTPVSLDGVTRWGETGWSVTCRKMACPEDPGKDPGVFFLACDKISQPMILRKRRTGDALKRPGRGSRTLKKLFIDQKIPLEQRDLLPVLADAAGVLAAVPFGPDEFRLARPGEEALRIQIQKE